MKYLPQFGLLAMVLCGLFPAQVCLASGNALPATPGSEFLLFGGQGYLGVDLGEIDSERAAALHLKDTHGAEVTMVDHDAPAAKAGFKLHDVILQVDGQPFDTADQLRRRLREMPAGRTVSFVVSRSGNPINMTVRLCDRSQLEHDAWKQHISVPDPAAPAGNPPSNSFLGKAAAAGPNFLANVLPKTLYIGVDVNPVKSQLADYFGVTSGTGLLVDSVDPQSPASRAGMKAGDIIVRVESEPLRSRSDWQKAIHRYRGRPAQITVMRNKQEQILTITAGKAKKS